MAKYRAWPFHARSLCTGGFDLCQGNGIGMWPSGGGDVDVAAPDAAGGSVAFLRAPWRVAGALVPEVNRDDVRF